MGPSQDHIKQVQLDAHRSTLRHLRDDAEDNGYKPAVSFEETDKQVTQQLEKGADAPVADNASVAPSNVPAGPNTDPSDVPASQAAPSEPTSQPARKKPTRDELNAQASEAGVEAPEKLPNMAAVKDAIKQAGEPTS